VLIKKLQYLLLLSNSGRWCNARRVRSIRLAVTLSRRQQPAAAAKRWPAGRNRLAAGQPI